MPPSSILLIAATAIFGNNTSLDMHNNSSNNASGYTFTTNYGTSTGDNDATDDKEC